MKPSINLSFRLLVLILSLILINCIYLIAPTSESINVTDYIKQYNFPTIVQMYLKPLEELDQSEKEFIDLLQGLPEDKQKDYAKEVYKNQSLTPELLEKIKQEKTAKKPVTIDDKISLKEIEGLSYKQESFIDRLKDRKIDLAGVEADVKLALGIIGKYPEWFDAYSSISGGQYKAEALLNLVKIAREIEPEIGMSAEIFLDKYCELVSTASNRMVVFYNARCGGKTGPLVDEKLDEKEYNLVKNHILYLVKKNEDKKLALNIAEPNKMNPLPVNDFKEMELWKSFNMEKMALNSIVLPYQLFTLKITSKGKITSVYTKTSDWSFINDSSKQLENAINNQKLTEKYYNKLEYILTSKNTLNSYLKKATTWLINGPGFNDNGVYVPDGNRGEKNSAKSIPYQFAKFLSKSDDWSKLNLAAVNMIMSKYRSKVKGDCNEHTNMVQHMMYVLGLPSYGIHVARSKYSGKSHRDIMISIPNTTLKNAEKKFGKLMKYENAISLFYTSETQINKVLDPITVVNIVLPADYYRGVIRSYDLRR